MASASGDGGQGAAGAYCATCGRPLTVGLVTCPNCGTPILGPTSPASWGTHPTPGDPAGAYQGQYLTPGMTPPAPPTGPAPASGAQAWASAPTVASADPATWQPLTPLAQRRGRRGVLVGSVAAVVVLSLLATGVAYLLGAFTAHTELDAAKYLPGNTVIFGGLDVVNMATNSHGIRQQDLTTLTGSDSTLKSGGLDFQADVMPWLGRDIAVGAFPGAGGGQSANPNPMSDLAAVVLLQSHDDGKAQAAMQKAANHRPDYAASGWAVTTASYNGFTLYTQPNERYDDASGTMATDPTGSTYAAGKGWAIIASNPAAAKLVIDRVNGTGDTLAAQKSFVDATSSLPSDRFGALYVNIQSLGDLITKSGGASLGMAGVSLQQSLQTYPTAAGYISWTNSGLHAQLTAKAARSTGITYPSGDTLGLAKVVPGNAYAYVALNNLGGDLTANKAVLAQEPQVTQMVQSVLGTSLDDPALAQPAALAVYPTAGTGLGIGGALLLKEDAASAATLVQKFVAAQHCTTEAITVAGQGAQKLTCAILGSPGATPTVTQTSTSSTDVTVAPGSNGTVISSTNTLTTTTGGTAIYVMQAGGALAVAPDEASLAPIAGAANGSPSLAQATSFAGLSAQAPSKAQFLAYADVNAILTASHAQARNAQGNLAERTAAVFITTVGDDTQSQVNIDVKLNG